MRQKCLGAEPKPKGRDVLGWKFWGEAEILRLSGEHAMKLRGLGEVYEFYNRDKGQITSNNGLSGGSTGQRNKGLGAVFSSWIWKRKIALGSKQVTVPLWTSASSSMKPERHKVTVKVFAPWGSPWRGHVLGLWLLGQDKCPDIPLGAEAPLAEFSKKPLISNILSPVLLKCNGMLNLATYELYL